MSVTPLFSEHFIQTGALMEKEVRGGCPKGLAFGALLILPCPLT